MLPNPVENALDNITEITAVMNMGFFLVEQLMCVALEGLFRAIHTSAHKSFQ